MALFLVVAPMLLVCRDLAPSSPIRCCRGFRRARPRLATVEHDGEDDDGRDDDNFVGGWRPWRCIAVVGLVGPDLGRFWPLLGDDLAVTGHAASLLRPVGNHLWRWRTADLLLFAAARPVIGVRPMGGRRPPAYCTYAAHAGLCHHPTLAEPCCAMLSCPGFEFVDARTALEGEPTAGVSTTSGVAVVMAFLLGRLDGGASAKAFPRSFSGVEAWGQ